MSEENKALARRALEDVYSGRNPDAADEIYSPDFVDHDPATPEDMRHGPEGIKQQAAMYQSAFADLKVTVDDQIAEGDRVVTRWVARGKHEGELMGVAPSGQQVEISGITIGRVAEGKVEEEWTSWDGLGMMEQIGALPSD